MDIANRQTMKLQARVKELEDDKDNLENELSEALQAPFKKREKKESPEKPVWFRNNSVLIDKTIDVYLNFCAFC